MTTITRSLIRFFSKSTAEASKIKAEAIATQKQAQVELATRSILGTLGNTTSNILNKTQSGLQLVHEKGPQFCQPMCETLARQVTTAQISTQNKLESNQTQAQDAKLIQARAIIKEVIAAKAQKIAARGLALSCVSEVAINTDLPTPPIHKALSISTASLDSPITFSLDSPITFSLDSPVSFSLKSPSASSLDLRRLTLSSEEINTSPLSSPSPVPFNENPAQENSSTSLPTQTKPRSRFIALCQKIQSNLSKTISSLSKRIANMIKPASTMQPSHPATTCEATSQSLTQIMQQQETATQDVMTRVLTPIFKEDTPRLVEAGSLLVNHATTTLKADLQKRKEQAIAGVRQMCEHL